MENRLHQLDGQAGREQVHEQKLILKRLIFEANGSIMDLSMEISASENHWERNDTWQNNSGLIDKGAP